MTGHSDEIMTSILWTDAELDGIQIDFNELVIRLTEPSKRIRQVRCKGYIGYSLIGFWDEIVIQNVELLDTSDFQLSCLHRLTQRYGETYPDTGDPTRNRRTYRTLSIELIDGTVLDIVAAEFTVE